MTATARSAIGVSVTGLLRSPLQPQQDWHAEGKALLARIASSGGELRKSERTVADYVVGYPNSVISLSIAQLAQRAGVSQPTVARFCQAMGFDGFRAFKLALAQCLAGGVSFVHCDVQPDDTTAEVKAKVFDRAITALTNVRNSLDTKALNRAIALLAAAERIEFYGLGNSGIVALDAQHKFFRLGVPTVAYADPHVHGMSATMLRPGMVVVAISSSGRTIDLIRSVDLARGVGAEVIGITSSGSPLADLCTVALYADVPENPDIYVPMSSRLAHLTIIDTLAVGVAMVRGPGLETQLQRAKETLIEKRVRGYEKAE